MRSARSHSCSRPCAPGGGHLAALDHLDEQPLHVLVVVPARWTATAPGRCRAGRWSAAVRRRAAARGCRGGTRRWRRPTRRCRAPSPSSPRAARARSPSRRGRARGPRLGRISPWWSMSRCSSSASRSSPGSYDDPSRLHSSRSALGATAEIGSCWTSVSRADDLEQVGRAAARPAAGPAPRSGGPAPRVSRCIRRRRPPGRPAGRRAPPSHDAIGSGDGAAVAVLLDEQRQPRVVRPAQVQLGAPDGHDDRRRQVRVGRHDAVVGQHLLQRRDLVGGEVRVVGDPDRAVLEVVHRVLVAHRLVVGAAGQPLRVVRATDRRHLLVVDVLVVAVLGAEVGDHQHVVERRLGERRCRRRRTGSVTTRSARTARRPRAGSTWRAAGDRRADGGEQRTSATSPSPATLAVLRDGRSGWHQADPGVARRRRRLDHGCSPW